MTARKRYRTMRSAPTFKAQSLRSNVSVSVNARRMSVNMRFRLLASPMHRLCVTVSERITLPSSCQQAEARPTV